MIFQKNGFTLVELIVAMAVVSAIAAIVLIAINPAQRIAQSQNISAIAAAKQIESGVEQYYTLNNRYPNIGCGGTWCSLAVEEPTFRNQMVASGILKEIPNYPTPDFAGCAITYFEKEALRFQLSFCLENFDPRTSAYFNNCSLDSPSIYLCQDTNLKYLCWYYESANLSRCFVANDPPSYFLEFFPYP